MGLLTPQPKKKGLLGGDVLGPLDPGMSMDEQPITQPQSMAGTLASLQTPIRQPGFFDRGGIGRTLAGTLGDTLATWAGGQATFAPMMQRRQAIEQEQRVHDRDLQDQLALFRSKQDYERANPKPINNDTANDYEYIKAHLGQAKADEYLNNVAAGQPIVVRNPDGTITPVSRGQFSGGAAGGPPATLPPDFDFGEPKGNMGIPSGAVSPGGSTPTVISRADAAPFIKSLGPEGFQRWMAKHNVRLGN